MTANAQEKRQRLKSRLNPKACIGYLVGYNSNNVFRIWNPVTDRVYATRDVIFNEQDSFSLDEVRMKETIGEQTLGEIQERLQKIITEQQGSVEEVITPEDGQDELEITVAGLDNGIQDLPVEDEESETEEQLEEPKYTESRFMPFPTPPESPAAAFLASSIRLGSQKLEKAQTSRRKACAINQAFYTGRVALPVGKANGKLISKAERRRIGRGKSKPQSEPHLQETKLDHTKFASHP